MFDTYAEIFAERAREYDFAMTSWPNARNAEFLSVLEPLRGKADGLVCDMPSGGAYLQKYLGSGMRYVAVDPASGFAKGPIDAQWVHAEISDVPLPDNSVDYIVSLAGLHHEPSLPAVFEEMRRLLRPDGVAVIADVAVNTPPATFLNGFVDTHNPLGHHGRFLDESLGDLIQDAGFKVLQDQLVHVPWEFGTLQDAGEFGRYLFGVMSLTAEEVSDELQRAIGCDLEGGLVRVHWVLRRVAIGGAR
jgi:SAM-dependent methyltransferase